ncbi:MAG: porin [Alphaproteobacteria bacterium]|nr:porin [Alphaproteobacteria bacterium]
MKNFLYGTTALIAAGFIAGSAMAQQAAPAKGAAEPLKLNITGYWSHFIAAGKEESAPINLATGGSINNRNPAAGRRNHGIAHEGEVHFAGSTTLNNGTKVGLVIELEARGVGDSALEGGSTTNNASNATAGLGTTGVNSNQIDQAFMWFEGSWGRFEAGQVWGAGLKMHYGGYNPTFGQFGELNNHVFFQTPSTSVAAANNITAVNTHVSLERFEKLTLYTPRLYGVQFGMSYTPDRGQNSRQGLAYFAQKDTEGEQGAVVEYALNYVNKFGGVNVGAHAVYLKAVSERSAQTPNNPYLGNANDDQQMYGYGLNLKFMNFDVGGSYKWDNMGAKNPARDRKQFEIGVGYNWAPFSFGVQYMENKADDVNNTAGAATSLAAAQAGTHTDKLQSWLIGGNYTLGPGIHLIAAYQTWKNTNGCPVTAACYPKAGATSVADQFAATENDAKAVIFGTRILF